MSPYYRVTKKSSFPKEASDILLTWLQRNKHHPYPTDQEKTTLRKETGLTMVQINNWFTNARRRVLKRWKDGSSSGASPTKSASPASCGVLSGTGGQMKSNSNNGSVSNRNNDSANCQAINSNNNNNNILNNPRISCQKNLTGLLNAPSSSGSAPFMHSQLPNNNNNLNTSVNLNTKPFTASSATHHHLQHQQLTGLDSQQRCFATKQHHEM